MGRKKYDLSKEYYYKYWMDRLTNLAVNMFEWKNLPIEINQAQMEKDIMLGAFSIFFKDGDTGLYFCLPGNITGVDVYGYPTKAKPVPKNGVVFPEYYLRDMRISTGRHRDIKSRKIIETFEDVKQNAVIIYANRTRSSAIPFITDYADKLSDLDIAIKMNTKAMKHPFAIKSTEQTKETMDTLMKQYDDNYYIIFADKSLSMGDIDVIDFKVSANEILDLQKEKETVLNEFFQLFGISGSVEKRERMIAGEMNAMMQQVGINRQMWMSARMQACEEIKKVFDLDIMSESIQINFEDFQSNENKEGGNEE